MFRKELECWRGKIWEEYCMEMKQIQMNIRGRYREQLKTQETSDHQHYFTRANTHQFTFETHFKSNSNIQSKPIIQSEKKNMNNFLSSNHQNHQISVD